MKKLAPYLLLIFTYSSCISVVKIQKSEEYIKQKNDVKKIVCISPDIVCFEGSGLATINYTKTLDYQKFVVNKLKKYGKKAGSFDYVIFHPIISDSLSTDYFNNLLPLKSELLETLFGRDIDINNQYSVGMVNMVQKSVFAEAPKISPEYSHLSKIYGTPYFSWYGVISGSKFSLLAMVVVNVETTEVMVRELIFSTSKLNKRNLPPLIYDSFKLIK